MIRNTTLRYSALIILITVSSLILTACDGSESTPADVVNVIEELPDEPEPSGTPVFAPLGGGGRAIYTVLNGDGGWGLGSAWQDGTDSVIFSNDDYKYWYFGGFSPDGTKFTGSCASDDNRLDIFIVNSDGSGLEIIRKHTDNTSYGTPTFVDDERILYAKGYADGLYQFYISPIYDPENETEITINSPRIPRGVWGERGIIFPDFVGQNTSDVFHLDSDTGEITRLFETPGANDQMLSWSPDGTQILWETAPSPNTIFLGEMETGGLTAITTGASPLWAPDGGILFLDISSFQFSYMNADGSGITPLTEIFPDLMAFASGGVILQP